MGTQEIVESLWEKHQSSVSIQSIIYSQAEKKYGLFLTPGGTIVHWILEYHPEYDLELSKSQYILYFNPRKIVDIKKSEITLWKEAAKIIKSGLPPSVKQAMVERLDEQQEYLAKWLEPFREEAEEYVVKV